MSWLPADGLSLAWDPSSLRAGPEAACRELSTADAPLLPQGPPPFSPRMSPWLVPGERDESPSQGCMCV